MLSIFRWLLVLLFSVILILLAVANRHDVTLSSYPLPYEITLPVYLFVLVFFLAGFAMATLTKSLFALKKGHDIRKQKQQIEALRNEVEGLRSERLTS